MKVNFKKRKKIGGGSNWGAGWDDLCQRYWEDLEQITEDNLYGRHDNKLIGKVFCGMEDIMENKVLPRINRYTQVVGKENREWMEMAKEVLGYFEEAKTVSDKVIAINAAEQFIRAAEPDSTKMNQILGDRDV